MLNTKSLFYTSKSQDSISLCGVRNWTLFTDCDCVKGQNTNKNKTKDNRSRTVKSNYTIIQKLVWITAVLWITWQHWKPISQYFDICIWLKNFYVTSLCTYYGVNKVLRSFTELRDQIHFSVKLKIVYIHTK